MIEYKGYNGLVEFDNEAGIFHGEVIHLRDVVTFQGTSVKELRKAFRDSIDDYLEHCASLGQDPEKPYSGKFVVRVEPSLHRAIAASAALEQKSLNAWVQETLAKAVQKMETYDAAAKRTNKTLSKEKTGASKQTPKSPLDIPSIDARITTSEIVSLIRKQRSKPRGLKSR